MTLEEKVCPIVLAGRLKYLGVNKKSDWYWDSHALVKTSGDYGITSDGEISAYTSEELGEMLPHHLKTDYVFTTYKMEDGGWFVDYTDMTPDPEKIGRPFMFTDPDGVDHTVCQSGKSESEARAKVLIFLLEHKLMRQPE